MLANAIENINEFFGVEFHDFERPGNCVLITSGFGIGLAIMDSVPAIKYFVDMDEYRGLPVDWEVIAVLLCLARPGALFMSGCFMGDSPAIFEPFKRGVFGVPLHIYLGNDKTSLSEFLINARGLTCA